VLLLRHQIVLLAMKHGRAPLPGLLRRGVLNDVYELGNIARRLSLLGDDRMFLAQLKVRTPSTRPMRETILSRDSEIAVEVRP
jgi:hypothetical protein